MPATADAAGIVIHGLLEHCSSCATVSITISAVDPALRERWPAVAAASVTPPTINSSVAALRFFFRVTLNHPEMGRHLILTHYCANLGAKRGMKSHRMGTPSGNQKVSRRLAAILAADIAGYSALMGADEGITVRDLKAHQAVILPMISEHEGRVIDTAGDGILAEFASVVNAV